MSVLEPILLNLLMLMVIGITGCSILGVVWTIVDALEEDRHD